MSPLPSEVTQRYTLLARLLHWLMAVGFLGMWICGFAMTTLVEDDGPLEETLFELHISFGVTLGALLVVRTVWRFLNAPPPLPTVFREWGKLASHVGHLLLYALPAIVIVIGWAEVDFGGHGVEWFGVPMPELFPKTDTLLGTDAGELMELLHMWFAYAMLAVAVVHILAVAKHRWIDGHDILYRLGFGSGK